MAYGQNEVAGAMYRNDGGLLVHSCWYTMQGEGPDVGRPAVFIRLAKCNLRCFFCDTEFETGEPLTVEQILGLVEAHIREAQGNCNLVVITGGEPLLQNILPLTERLNIRQFEVAIETAGTVYVEGMADLFQADRSIHGNIVVCSPKTPKLNEHLIPIIGAFKYILSHGDCDPDDGLPSMSTQIRGDHAKLYRRPAGHMAPVYVQPMDEGNYYKNNTNMKTATKVCLRHGYRLSLQTHKIIGVD